VADFGGSTEYAGDAIVVPIRELRKPVGIYGNWDVPGKWGEPDYDVLVEKMRDVYANYSTHKSHALELSDTIRTKFSWEAAAKKAYAVLEELSTQPIVDITPTLPSNAPDNVTDPEQSIKAYARGKGYEITSMRKCSVIFTVDCHPSDQPRLDCLIETLKQIKALGYPICISSHMQLPSSVLDLVDYHIYDKRDILSGDDKPIYFRSKSDGTIETTPANIPCHALASTQNFQNAIDVVKDKYDWVYNMSYDTEVDLEEWIKLVLASPKPFICCHWEDDPLTVSGQLFASTTDIARNVFPRMDTWEDFKKEFGDNRFCGEKHFYEIMRDKVGLDNIEFLSIPLGNRFDQVDREAWKDDVFQCNFVEGPFLNIVGISNREYEVSYSNPIDGADYVIPQKVGMWSRPNKKYYRDWTIVAKLDGEEKFRHHLELKNQNVLISMGSKALGDTLAWMPYIEKFRLKHGCNVYCSTWWNNILDYPDIHFIKPGDTVNDVYASYDVGCFDDQLDRNVKNWRLTTLQQVASDILGLEYEPLRTRLIYTPYKPKGNGHPPKPYICFSEFSTMRNKLWNREGAWQKIIDYLNSLGYDCVSISAEASQLTGIINHNGQSIEQTLTDISGCEFYIGLNAGPSWIAYSLNKPVVMITGVSEEWNDFPNPYRIAVNNEVCGVGCFNDPSLPINRGWEWCPRDKDYICTKSITEDMVISVIDRLRNDKQGDILGTQEVSHASNLT
jgi:autotransporter strand-loop-strand O-heptosyltransferase